MAGSDADSAPVYLTLRDTQSSTLIEVDVTGTIFGRRGEGADIEIDDRAVSGEHARIFRKRGKWWIEDLGSSNGTFVGGERIREPVELHLGARIEIGRYTLEVLNAIEPSGVRTAPGSRGPADSKKQKTVADVDPHAVTATRIDTPSSSLATTKAASDAAPVAVTAPTPAPLALTEPANGLHATEPAAAAEKTVRAPDATIRRRTAELRFLGRTHDPVVVYLAKTVPRAVLHYAVELPLFLINPPGRLREEIASERFTALTARGLVAFVWGAAVLSGMIGAITTGIGVALYDVFDPAALIGTAVFFGLGTLIALVFHPVLAWVIETLGGESSSISRSNFFVGIHLAPPIFAAAGLVSVAAGRLSEPYATLTAVALVAAATLLSLYILFCWLRLFELDTWALVLLLVASALLFVGPANDVTDAVRAHAQPAEMDLPAGQVTEIPP